MRTLMFSIFDNKSLVYSPPFNAATAASAIRMLTDTVNDRNTSIAKHPGDYVLYIVGEYDDSNGLMAACSPLQHVVDAVALVKHQPQLFSYDEGKQDGFRKRENAPAISGK